MIEQSFMLAVYDGAELGKLIAACFDDVEVALSAYEKELFCLRISRPSNDC